MFRFEKFEFERPRFLNRPRHSSIGYARAPISLQSSDLQVLDLKRQGCTLVFQEAFGVDESETACPQLQAALKALSIGDELVVATIDCIGRSQVEVVTLVHTLQQRGVHIRTLDGFIDTRSLGDFARPIIGLFSAFIELERSFTCEKTNQVNYYRRGTGKNLGGRPKTNPAKEGLVIRLRNEGCSYRSIREQTGLALSTIRRIIVEKEGLILDC